MRGEKAPSVFLVAGVLSESDCCRLLLGVGSLPREHAEEERKGTSKDQGPHFQPAECLQCLYLAPPETFDAMFTSNHSPLRTLLNMELKALHSRTARLLPEEMLQMQRRFHRAYEKEKAEAVDHLIADLATIENDPNFGIDSLFRSQEHLTRILESPAFYTHDVLNSMVLVASVPEVSDVLRAIRITTADLSSLNAALFATPMQDMTSPEISQLRIYKPVGRQNSLRPSIVNRLNHVFKTTWTAFTRFFDNKVELLHLVDRTRIRNTVRRSIAAGHGQAIYRSSPLVDLLDSHGFVTAVALTALTTVTSSAISVLDERNRLFRVSCAACSRPGYSFVASREGFLHFSEGRSMEKVSGVQSAPLHVFGGLSIWEAKKASLSRELPCPHIWPGSRGRTHSGLSRCFFAIPTGASCVSVFPQYV